MKAQLTMRNIVMLAATVGLMVGVAGTKAAPISAGTQLGLDFGPTVTNLANNDWNEITSNGTYSTIHDLDGVSIDGLSVTVAGPNGYNNDGTNSWVGLSTNGGSAPSPFVDSVTTDITYDLNDLITVTISGLDDSLSYDIYTVSTAPYTPIDTYTVLGDATYGPSAISRPTAVSNGLFHTFLGVGTNGSGDITIQVTDGNGANPIINGILIEVIPEPATLILLSLGACGLGGHMRRRRGSSAA